MLWGISEGTKSKRGKRILCSTINPSDTATFVRSCPMAETLYNAHDFMVNYLVGRGGCAQLCNSVRIARKHGYDLNEKNASRWVDTICMLRDVGRDINSPHYICPQSTGAHPHNQKTTAYAFDEETLSNYLEGIKKAGYKLFWLGCGDADPWFAEAQDLDKLLTQHGMPHTFYVTGGGHEWKNWRHYLDTFAPLLFK